MKLDRNTVKDLRRMNAAAQEFTSLYTKLLDGLSDEQSIQMRRAVFGREYDDMIDPVDSLKGKGSLAPILAEVLKTIIVGDDKDGLRTLVAEINAESV